MLGGDSDNITDAVQRSVGDHYEVSGVLRKQSIQA
jgi:hypothetical protein